MTMLWLGGLVRRRAPRLAALAGAVAIAVSLLASIAVFVSHALATMTTRAASSVGVDWQVEVQPGFDANAVVATVGHQPDVRVARTVNFGQTSGVRATTGGTTQTTGPGIILGLPADYGSTFPGTVRLLAGSANGPVVAQQTASNLHVAPGDTVLIGRAGLPNVAVTVAGVVDLTQSDSLFQKVGAPAGSQPQATPDNVVALPPAMWHAVFDPLRGTRPDLVRTQVQVRIDHSLPHDPAKAFSKVLGLANNLEVKLGGAGRIGNNLGAALDAARSDAVYAQFLFLLLGLPGIALAGLLTATVADASSPRRRSEQALLRTRGAALGHLVRLAVAEAAIVAVAGGLAGIGVASALGMSVFHDSLNGAGSATTIVWTVLAVLVAVAIATAAIVVPALRDARALTVAASRRIARRHRPLWMRLGVDIWMLAGGILAFWLSSRNGYQLVVAPEGVPSISVSYWPFAAPLFLWIGGALLGLRLSDVTLRRGRRVIALAVRPMSAGLAETVAASMQRQRALLARGAVLVAVAFSFAASSAVFNDTFRAQAHVDALLTNGADVTVTEPAAARVPASFASQLARVRGVAKVEAMQHRYAYVGADLQDLFGVDPQTIVKQAKLQNAYFQGGSAHQLMARLASRPDNILVSAETVHDFQLQRGDALHLRIRDARTRRLIPITFHYAGIAKELPTAPRDSFLIANRAYVSAQTGSDAVGAFLVTTNGPRAQVAARLRNLVGTSATVTNLDDTKAIIGSSLTALDLSGLTRVELAYAVVLVAAMGGLVLWLGFAERRRMFTIASALGASSRQVGAFVWSEAIYVTLAGALVGLVGAWTLSHVIVKVLTGVFDPPPDHLVVPWRYLILTGLGAIGAIAVAGALTLQRARRPDLAQLRDL